MAIPARAGGNPVNALFSMHYIFLQSNDCLYVTFR